MPTMQVVREGGMWYINGFQTLKGGAFIAQSLIQLTNYHAEKGLEH